MEMSDGGMALEMTTGLGLNDVKHRSGTTKSCRAPLANCSLHPVSQDITTRLVQLGSGRWVLIVGGLMGIQEAARNKVPRGALEVLLPSMGSWERRLCRWVGLRLKNR